MVAGRVAVLLNHLRECQLLDAKQVAEIAGGPLARGDDPMPLAKALVQRYGLTSFQVNQLLRGRGKALVLGPYRLLDRIGEGGMGQVFKAYHQPMDRTVALKVIRKELLANPTAVSRFYQEVRAAAQLTHPNIVLAHDAGKVGETHYFAMEYVEGTDLGKLIKERGPLPVAQACDYIRQAAQGLQHAYERRLVHRDIKPSNLLVSAAAGSGESPPATHQVVKILDMGLARSSGSADETQVAGLTQTGAVVGTPHFLAPEQARNSRGVDIRADLYSLGCTLFYLLTGQPPYTGQELTEILLKHQMDPFPSVTGFRKDVPAGVQAILQKLTAKKPEDRYQTPADLAAALAPFAGSPDETAIAEKEPASRVRSAPRQIAGLLRKKPVLIGVGVAALGLVLLLGLVIAVSSLSSGSNAMATRAEAAKTTTAATRREVPELFGLLAKSVKAGDYRKTEIVGGFGGEEQLPDLPPDGALLVGFEVGQFEVLSKPAFIMSIRPIYRTAEGEKQGRQYGNPPKRITTYKAKEGYAVGAVEVNPGLVFHGFVITFMKIGDKALEKGNSYTSPQIGAKTDKKSGLGGNGAPIIGIVTRQGADGALVGLGLIVRKG